MPSLEQLEQQLQLQRTLKRYAAQLVSDSEQQLAEAHRTYQQIDRLLRELQLLRDAAHHAIQTRNQSCQAGSHECTGCHSNQTGKPTGDASER